MKYNFVLYNFVNLLWEYTSGTQKVVQIPLIDSIYLDILQVLKLKFAKIYKRGGGGGQTQTKFQVFLMSTTENGTL